MTPSSSLILRCSRRIAYVRRMRVFEAPCAPAQYDAPPGFDLVRIRGGDSSAPHEIPIQAMREAMEPCGLATARLSSGDEFFGWMSGGKVASFGWVTFRDTAIGDRRWPASKTRPILFNFYTMSRFRGKRLYPALLHEIRRVLYAEQAHSVVLYVNENNTASLKAVHLAGFMAFMTLRSLVVLNRWSLPLSECDLASVREPPG